MADFPLRRLATILGIVVGILSSVYFVLQLRSSWKEITALPWDGSVAAGLAAAVAVQFLFVLVDAVTWGFLLRGMGVPANTRDAMALFGIAQFAKYLPGNVVQHIGRVAGARALGWQTGRVVLSLLVENGFALGAGGLVAGAGLLLSSAGEGPTTRLSLSVAALVVGWLAGALTLRYFLSKPPPWFARLLAMEQPVVLGSGLLIVYLLTHILSYAAMGAGLALVLRGLAGHFPDELWRVPAAVALSWLAGYLAPGAPAGLGVREATLTALLGPSIGTAVVVSAALVWRLAALLTDAAMLVAGLALRRRGPS